MGMELAAPASFTAIARDYRSSGVDGGRWPPHCTAEVAARDRAVNHYRPKSSGDKTMCMHCKGISRRGFPGSRFGRRGRSRAAGRHGARRAGRVRPGAAPKTKIRVAKIYLAQPHAGWPKPNLDVPADVKRYEAGIRQARPEPGPTSSSSAATW